ncbi:MAG TPA: biopolymer transporter ExbD [Hanamia sp.]|jgi:biopolymer transport protein ExbD|nr:biopolymer transporter ExbD [Hanamia sp.]
MARAKIKRGSTTVDMTAMCDVAFLLLTFFILATKFKPSDAINVTPPSSVSNKHAPQKDYFNVTIDKENKVYLDMDDAMKGDVLDELGKERNITFSPADIQNFKAAAFVGVPFSQLKSFIALTPEQLKATKLPGIPTDSTNNELQAWISAAVNANLGKKLNFLIKGDDNSKYTAFKGVLDAFKKNDIYKYNLVTNAEDVPEGSELYKKNMAGEAGK